MLTKKYTEYTCKSCYYFTCNKTNYDKHLTTHKHKMLTNVDTDRKQSYNCQVCDYATVCKDYYNKHLGSKKHQTRLFTSIAPKSLFICNDCDYTTDKKPCYNKHLETNKHKCRTQQSVNSHDVNAIQYNKKYFCNNCSKEFSARQSLFVHKKRCALPLNNTVMPTIINNLITQNDNLQNIIMEQAKQQEEDRRLKYEGDNQIRDLLIEITKKENTTIINNTQNNFNINMFLNDKCKDAMNFLDFVESLHISFEELENMAHKGYVTGMSDIIINGLNQLDVYHRPIHCTDIKRETMYIKDNNEWIKDNNQTNIQKIINMVSKKNMRKVPEWQRAHPNSDIIDSKEQYLHMNIMQQCLNSGCLSECKRNDAKIIKNIAKFTYLDRGRKIT